MCVNRLRGHNNLAKLVFLSSKFTNEDAEGGEVKCFDQGHSTAELAFEALKFDGMKAAFVSIFSDEENKGPALPCSLCLSTSFGFPFPFLPNQGISLPSSGLFPALNTCGTQQ